MLVVVDFVAGSHHPLYTHSQKRVSIMSEIAIAAGFSALVIFGAHYFHWRTYLHRDLYRSEAYIIGLLAILIPITFVLAIWQDWSAILLLAACAGAAGITTLAAKAADKATQDRNELLDRRQRD
jgi:hypothetical protein